MERFSKNSLSNLSEHIYPWTKRTVEKGIGAIRFGLVWIDSQGSQDKSYPRPIHVDIPWKTEQWKISTNTLCKLFFFFLIGNTLCKLLAIDHHQHHHFWNYYL